MEGGGCLENQNSTSLGPKSALSAESRIVKLQECMEPLEVS